MMRNFIPLFIFFLIFSCQTDLSEKAKQEILQAEKDFAAYVREHGAADMPNAKTQQADHYSRSLDQLLSQFSTARTRLIEKLKAVDEKTAGITSLHPRLQQPMRPVDSIFFVAEHNQAVGE